MRGNYHTGGGGGTPTDTAWTSYTPAIVGAGSPTGLNFYYRMDGPDVLIRGSFTSGVSTAVEARIPLPAGMTSTANMGALEHAGVVDTTDINGVTSILMEPGVTYLTISAQNSIGSGLVKLNGDQAFASGSTYSFQARVPVA